MNEFIRQLKHQEKLHRKSGANSLADLYMNAANDLKQQQIDKSVLEQELETTNRHLRLSNRKIKRQDEETPALRERVAELERIRDDVLILMSHSNGVAGLHLNGELANWGSLRLGGYYESWLCSIDEYEPLPQPPKESSDD